jgi:hypothetical protein
LKSWNGYPVPSIDYGGRISTRPTFGQYSRRKTAVGYCTVTLFPYHTRALARVLQFVRYRQENGMKQAFTARKSGRHADRRTSRVRTGGGKPIGGRIFTNTGR